MTNGVLMTCSLYISTSLVMRTTCTFTTHMTLQMTRWIYSAVTKASEIPVMQGWLPWLPFKGGGRIQIVYLSRSRNRKYSKCATTGRCGIDIESYFKMKVSALLRNGLRHCFTVINDSFILYYYWHIFYMLQIPVFEM